MNDTTYNGWTNYETWSAKLWMDNDESSYHYWNHVAAQYAGDAYELGKVLEEYYDEAAEQWMSDQASFFADIFNAALQSVNWLEIAESLLEDIEDAA